MAPSAMSQQTTSNSSQRCEPGSVNIPIAKWPTTASDGPVDAHAIATEVVQNVNSYLFTSPSKEAANSIASLFRDDCYWRDHLALSWDLRTLKGKDQITSLLQSNSQLTKVELDTSTEWRSPNVKPFDPQGTVRGIQFYTVVTTKVGSGHGVVRLAEENGKWKIWTFFTALEEIKGHEEPSGQRRPNGVDHGANLERKNWTDKRKKDVNFEQHEPDVLIIGAGQGGLTAHARLKMLNVPTLVIDSNDAVGDNWRKRYHQLVLHDPVWVDHLPYIPFPPFWPIFTPKDKLAEFFDSYAKLLELNIWMKTTLQSVSWDGNKKRWTVTLKRLVPDGKTETRTLHPKHIIQATGHSGKKNFPTIKGIDAFKGDILCHSSEFPGAKPNSKGKKAVVVGACNSSHDICQDYYENGYDVTMVQRSSTCVVTSESICKVLLAGAYEEGGPPTEDADLGAFSLPSEVVKAVHSELAKIQRKKDAPTLDGLIKAGFKVDHGPDDCGLNIKYYQRGGGYYIDVGASKLIIDGKIKIKQGQEIAEIMPRGLKFADGTELEADEIIFATGYQNMRTQARDIFGDEVADKVGDVWGYDEGGEFRGLWRKSGHPGFWFHGGNLSLCRYYSRVLALQIKAQLEGLD